MHIVLFSVSNTKEESSTLRSSLELDFTRCRIILLKRFECCTTRSTFLYSIKLFLEFNYSVKITNKVKNFVFSDKLSTQSIFYYAKIGFPYCFTSSPWISFGHVIKNWRTTTYCAMYLYFQTSSFINYVTIKWVMCVQENIEPSSISQRSRLS